MINSITIVRRNFFTEEIDISDNKELTKIMRNRNTSDGNGFCFSSWKNNVMTKESFIKADAILVDFNGGISKEKIKEILSENKLRAIFIPSRNNFLRTGTEGTKLRYHLILPLKESILSSDEYIDICEKVHKGLFYRRTNTYMHQVDRYFYYSDSKSEITIVNCEGMRYIDEFNDDDFPSSEKTPSVFSTIYNGKLSIKGLRRHLTKSKMPERDLEEITENFEDKKSIQTFKLTGVKEDMFLDFPLENVTNKTPTFRNCFLHPNSAPHKGVYLKYKTWNSTSSFVFLCLEHLQIFFPRDKEPFNSSENIYLPPGELNDFEKKGYFIGELSKDKKTYFIINKKSLEWKLINQEDLKSVLNSLYRELYEDADMSGWAYYRKVSRNKKPSQIIDEPRKRNDNDSSDFYHDINVFRGFTMRNPQAKILKKIYDETKRKKWATIFQGYCPNISLLLQNLMGHDFEIEALKWFLNWLSGSFCYLEKAQTGVIFNGNPKSGVDILYEDVLTALFGSQRVGKVIYKESLEKDNSFLVGKSLLLLQEPPFYKKDSYDLINLIAYWVSSNNVQITDSSRNQFQMGINCNFIWKISRNLPETMSRNDQTFSIFKSFTPITGIYDRKGRRIIRDGFRQSIKKELNFFSQFLLAWDFDREMFQSPYVNSVREMALNSGAGELFGLLKNLTEFEQINEIVPVDVPAREDVIKELSTTMKDKNSPYISVAVLRQIYNSITKENKTANSLSRSVREITGVKSTVERLADKKTARCFNLNLIRMGLEQYIADPKNIKFKKYLPIYHNSYDKGKIDEAAVSVSHLFQDNSNSQLLFPDRPIFSLKFDSSAVDTPGNKFRRTEMHSMALRTNENEHLFLNSEINFFKPVIGIERDLEKPESDLLPLNEYLSISRMDLDQFLTKHEAEVISEYLRKEFNLKVSISPPEKVVLNFNPKLYPRLEKQKCLVYRIPNIQDLQIDLLLFLSFEKYDFKKFLFKDEKSERLKKFEDVNISEIAIETIFR